MLKYVTEPIKKVFNKHPLIANCVTYGMFTSSAEFLQQSIAIYDQSKAESGNTTVSINRIILCIYFLIYS